MPVDREAAERLDKALRERLEYGLAAVRSEREHAIEIELPFLQHALGMLTAEQESAGFAYGSAAITLPAGGTAAPARLRRV